MTEFFKIINRYGIHSCRTFTNRDDALQHASKLNNLRDLGWRVVSVWG